MTKTDIPDWLVEALDPTPPPSTEMRPLPDPPPPTIRPPRPRREYRPL